MNHLLNIVDYDKVLVLKDGEIVENNYPFLLLAEKPSDEEITLNSEFASIIGNEGELFA